MPRGDRTGPAGFGPMTGRGFGYCRGYGQPGFMAPGFGWGRGRGRGFGRGQGWGYPGYAPQPPTAKEEREVLTEDLKDLEEELKVVKARLSELKGQK